MTRIIRVGTRNSQLATWQANWARQLLAEKNTAAELVFIKSGGDIDLHTPLYEMGVQGIFTRELDSALLNHQIDLAVHSLKDVPVQLANGLCIAAILPRGPAEDLLVFKDEKAANRFLHPAGSAAAFTVATSSTRRKAQWLRRYPHHQIESLRGNVNTRLSKLQEEPWDAALFAKAGLERIALNPEYSLVLDWMIPAPAQGAVVLVCRQESTQLLASCASLNHTETAVCTRIERAFLHALKGGCTAPVAALAKLTGNLISLNAAIFSKDGKAESRISLEAPASNPGPLGETAAAAILNNGGKAIIDQWQQHE